MTPLPKTIVPTTWRKILVILVPLWLILFPMIALIVWLSIYQLLDDGKFYANILISGLILGVFLFGVTGLLARIIKPLTLTSNGIEITRGRSSRLIPWSKISHIETGRQRNVRFVSLYLKNWQISLDAAQGCERRKLIWKNLWIVRDHVRVNAMPLKLSHNDLRDLIETYFQASKDKQ